MKGTNIPKNRIYMKEVNQAGVWIIIIVVIKFKGLFSQIAFNKYPFFNICQRKSLTYIVFIIWNHKLFGYLQKFFFMIWGKMRKK